MQEVETDQQTHKRPAQRIPVRSAVPVEDKTIKRRSRFDSVLGIYVTPEERDNIRAYQAEHGTGEYPPKYQAQLEEARRKMDQDKHNAIGKISKPAQAAPKIVTAQKPADVPISVRARAKDLVSEVMAENEDELNEMTPEAYTRLQLSLLKKFEAVLTK